MFIAYFEYIFYIIFKPCLRINNPFWWIHPIDFSKYLIGDWIIQMNQSPIRSRELSIDGSIKIDCTIEDMDLLRSCLQFNTCAIRLMTSYFSWLLISHWFIKLSWWPIRRQEKYDIINWMARLLNRKHGLIILWKVLILQWSSVPYPSVIYLYFLFIRL